MISRWHLWYGLEKVCTANYLEISKACADGTIFSLPYDSEA